MKIELELTDEQIEQIVIEELTVQSYMIIAEDFWEGNKKQKKKDLAAVDRVMSWYRVG